MEYPRALVLANQVTVMSNGKERGPGRLKLVLIGNQHVGKTSLLQRYIYDTYNPAYTYTSGGHIFQKNLVVDGRQICLSLLDTAGQSDVRSLIQSIYRDANGIMVVFDVTNEQSFDMVEDWIFRISQHTLNSPQLVLVGNKDDLTSYRKIQIERACQRAESFSATYYDVSAKTGYNVREAFEALIKSTWRNLQPNNNVDFTDTIRLEEKHKVDDNPCCTS